MSMLTLVAALALAPAISEAPLVPAGASKEFHEAFRQTAQRVEKGDFAGAERAATLLPKRVVRIQWKDQAVPADRRDAYLEARQAAFDAWMRFIRPLEFVIVSDKPDLLFDFAESIDAPEQGELPRGAVHFFSLSSHEPRLETVIALQRADPLEATTSEAVFNEVAYSVGAYFGIARAPKFGTAMGRSDQPTRSRVEIGQVEIALAHRIFDTTEKLRKIIEAKETMHFGTPNLWVESARVDLGEFGQGDEAGFQLQIGNNGDGDLEILSMSDCVCLAVRGPGALRPGEIGLVRAGLDTVNFTGELVKKAVLYTNDPENPVREVQVTLNVERTVEFSPRTTVLIMDEEGASATFYMVVSPRADVMAIDANLRGVKGTVTLEDWTGTGAESGVGAPSAAQKGYRLKVAIPPQDLYGRRQAMLVIDTGHERFRSVMHGFGVQKGIVSLPERAYFGRVGAAPQSISVTISRPGKKFRVLEASTNSNLFSASIGRAAENGDVIVTVAYKGGAPAGTANAQLTVKTDDPNQPTLIIPIEAITG
ncbi:MAG: hypothetical protein ACK4XJ_06625 [Fimbriimonadaceae bacterium]